MIRINLLPYKESTLIQWGQRQLLVYVAALVVSALVCVVWYGRLPDPEAKKRKIRAERAKYEQKIAKVKGQTFCDADRYKTRIKKAKRKYKAVERLITRRRSPKKVLREMSRILSEAWGPKPDRRFAGKDKSKLYNVNWDPSSVWITVFNEKGRLVAIEGGAKASDDVAEFWRRLQVSAFFTNVDLERFDKVGRANAENQHLRFSIKAGVRY